MADLAYALLLIGGFAMLVLALRGLERAEHLMVPSRHPLNEGHAVARTTSSSASCQ